MTPTDRAAARSRAGQAMHRTQAGIITGARAAIVRDGVRKLSMIAVAELGGVAKATVYNHVRDKPALLALVAHDLTDRLFDVGRGVPRRQGLAAALAAVAQAASDDDVVRATAEREPAVIGRLLRTVPTSIWDGPRDRLRALAARHNVEWSAGQVDLVLRWLVTQAAAPPDAAERDDVWAHQIATLLS